MYLNCHSFHSLRYGTIPLEELISQATFCGVNAMALTDINTVTGIYDFIKGCKAFGIKPIVGMEFRSEQKLRFIGLAKSASGLAEMNRFLTRHNFDNTVLPESAPEFEDVFVIYPLENAPLLLKENEYIGIRPEQLQKLVLSDWKKRQEKMVILQPVTFRTRTEFNLHRILRAIDMNLILSKLTPDDYCLETEVMRPMEYLISFYAEYPQIISNTEKIIAECNFELDFKTAKNKKFYTNSKTEEMILCC
jgi:DNA polymerase-3 subunit alpha/error-prone DNA polymerase